ncbi:unnamed protein product, partial [Allacma fusca]
MISEASEILDADTYLFTYREWICKLVLALNFYTYVSSINWMFVEGHYINSKLTSNVFQKKFHIKTYCWFSWGLPVLVVGPVLAVLLGNLAFLVNIMRVLFSNLPVNRSSSDAQRYRRAAKSALILFPLLGINNLIFFFNPGGSGLAYYMMANAIIQPLQGIL